MLILASAGLIVSIVFGYITYLGSLNQVQLLWGILGMGCLFFLLIVGAVQLRRRFLLKTKQIVSALETKSSQLSADLNLYKSENETIEKQTQTLQKSIEEKSAEVEDLGKQVATWKAACDEQKKLLKVASKNDVLFLLGSFQKRGRLIDFLQGDISMHPDQIVGAVARSVHQGCAAVLQDCFGPQPVESRNEGTPIELPDDFSRTDYAVSGNIGEAPFIGKLKHRGWKVSKISIPETIQTSNQPANIISPAEVMIP